MAENRSAAAFDGVDKSFDRKVKQLLDAMSPIPSLVLLPGLLNDERLWGHQAASLKDLVDVSVPLPTDETTIPHMAARVLAQAPARFVLGGLSMGGYVALEIMRQAPERVLALILMDTSARADTPEQTSRRRDLVRLAAMGRFKGVTPRLLPSLVARSSLGKPEVTDAIMSMAERLGRDVYIRQQGAIIGRVDSRQFLPQISCPTLVAVGAEDMVTPTDVAREISGLIPHSELAIIEESGHLAPLEQPEVVTALIELFLKRQNIV